ncbi:MAG TPA: TIGR02186 family protein [Stellaceae bacterium]|nr:TIGR02186 family protein [Stellaceae bacterium]
MRPGRGFPAALFALALLSAAPSRAEIVAADLSSHSIAITTGFTGASVVLFGATDGLADVVAVVRGPDRDVTVWEKGKVAGIWANTDSVTFVGIPSFYAVAATRPLADALSPGAAALYKIGSDNLKFETKFPTDPERAKRFARALIDVRKRTGVFSSSHEKIAFLGDRLFRTTFFFPANIPTGSYLVEVFLVRDKDVVGGQTTPLVVSKVGVDAAVFNFAHSDALAYGAIAVMMAVMAGWIASLPFRNS